MSELLIRRSPLVDVYQLGVFGAATDTPGIHLQERRNLTIIQVATYADTAITTTAVIAELAGVTPADQPCRAAIHNNCYVLWNGPYRWWIVEPEGRELAMQLAARLGDDAAVTEHSHARSVIRISGIKVRELLAKGSNIDFHPAHFMAGWSRPMQLGHIACMMHCVDDTPTVDIYVARSFALSFWEWVTDAAGEYGYTVA